MYTYYDMISFLSIVSICIVYWLEPLAFYFVAMLYTLGRGGGK